MGVIHYILKIFRSCKRLVLPSLVVLLTTQAHAQDLADIFVVSDSQNETYLDIGVGAASRSLYVGSDERESLVLPYANGEYKGRLYFKPGLGAGVHLINTDSFRLSGGGTLSLGRDSEQTPIIGALGEIKTGVLLNSAARFYTPIGAFDITGQVPVSGGLSGTRIDALFSTEIKPIPALRITPGVRATYQSSGWLNALYGISQDQAFLAGTTAFSLDGRVSTLGTHSVFYLTVDENIELLGAVNYSHLIGDVKDSPLTPKNDGLTVAIGIAKKF